MKLFTNHTVPQASFLQFPSQSAVWTEHGTSGREKGYNAYAWHIICTLYAAEKRTFSVSVTACSLWAWSSSFSASRAPTRCWSCHREPELIHKSFIHKYTCYSRSLKDIVELGTSDVKDTLHGHQLKQAHWFQYNVRIQPVLRYTGQILGPIGVRHELESLTHCMWIILVPSTGQGRLMPLHSTRTERPLISIISLFSVYLKLPLHVPPTYYPGGGNTCMHKYSAKLKCIYQPTCPNNIISPQSEVQNAWSVDIGGVSGWGGKPGCSPAVALWSSEPLWGRPCHNDPGASYALARTM